MKSTYNLKYVALTLEFYLFDPEIFIYPSSFRVWSL